MAKKADPKEQYERFVASARALGLDTKEAGEAFDRAMKKVARPKKKGDVAPPKREK